MDDKGLVRTICCLLMLPFGIWPARAADRSFESVLPALAYGPSCSSTVLLQNLADMPVTVEMEAHRAGGALVPVTGHPNLAVQLEPGQESSYKVEIDDETTAAWVKVREKIPESQSTPAVAVRGATECRAGNELRTASREVAYPTRNPWFSSDVTELHGAVITLINTSEKPARASVCYSAGNLYSVPTPGQPAPELQRICSETSDVQIPPFGTREFPVERGGNSYFSLRTRGDAVVLQMLRRANEGVRIYTVDSSIQFGEEVPEGKGPRR